MFGNAPVTNAECEIIASLGFPVDPNVKTAQKGLLGEILGHDGCSYKYSLLFSCNRSSPIIMEADASVEAKSD